MTYLVDVRNWANADVRQCRVLVESGHTSVHATVVAKGLIVQDLGLLSSIAATLVVLLAVRRWAASRAHLRAGAILLLIGIPVLLVAKAVGEAGVLQSDAIIWPLMLISTSLPVFGAWLLLRGMLGALRNAAQQRRSE